MRVCEEEDAHIRHTLDTAPPPPPPPRRIFFARRASFASAKSGPCLVSHTIFLCVSVCEEEDAHIRHTLDTLDTHYIRNTLATH